MCSPAPEKKESGSAFRGMVAGRPGGGGPAEKAARAGWGGKAAR